MGLCAHTDSGDARVSVCVCQSLPYRSLFQTCSSPLSSVLSRLEELFLCLNEYTSVSPCSVPCPSLRLLHITDNRLQDWAEVRKLGLMFPGLDTLVMANNNLNSIQDSRDMLPRLFPNLRSVNLHNSGSIACLYLQGLWLGTKCRCVCLSSPVYLCVLGLATWDDIEKLNCFPKLEEIRLQGVPLLQTYTNTERRSLMIAQ